MSPEKQRIAIAEACGWKIHPKDRFVVIPPNSPHSVQPLHTVPDYLNDLNAMREAEKVLPSAAHWIGYVSFLEGPCEQNGAGFLVHATAAQKAEAFLRVMNKWEGGDHE